MSASSKKRRVEHNRALTKILKEQPCMDCGKTFPHYVMDFDHRDPSDKRGGVAKMMYRTTKVLLQEIGKCDLVCANCHRIRTHSMALSPSPF